MKINFKWKKNKDSSDIIFVGNVCLGGIEITNDNKFLCLFEIGSLRFVICKTKKEAEIYIESKLKNWISNLLKGIKNES